MTLEQWRFQRAIAIANMASSYQEAKALIPWDIWTGFNRT